MKFIFYILILFLISCSSKQTRFETEEDFNNFLNKLDNGFIQSKEIGDFLYEVKLIPSLLEDKNDDVSFQLRLSRKDGGSVLDYGNVEKSEALTREGFLSFEIKDFVHLECNDKLIPCQFNHYERNYGLKPTVDILFHFSKVKPNKDLFFVFRDELFHQGLIRIKFNKDLFIKYHVQKK
jgi:hypothetical protein